MLSLAMGLLAPAAGLASLPPILHVRGETLEWTAAGRHNTYRLLTVAPGEWAISTVHGRSVTPPTIPGMTAHYWVKAAYNESRWSNPVSITYPGGKEEPSEVEPPEGTPEAEPIWIGDPAAPILGDWANIAAEPGRITRVPFPAVPGGFAYRDEIRNGDDPGGYGERSEIAQGNPTRQGFEDRLFTPGENVWIASSFWLAGDYPIDFPTWNSIEQLKQLGSLGVPVLDYGIVNGKLQFSISGTNEGGPWEEGTIPWEAPVRREQLIKLVTHVIFSPNPKVGFVQGFADVGSGMQPSIPPTRTWTMKQEDGVAVDSQARIGQYRDGAVKAGTSHAYFGPYVVAATRQEAEALAFP